MSVIITQYKWAGKWGPFSIKTVCDECELSKLVIGDMIESKWKDKGVTFEVYDWLPNWWKVIWKGAWHAPIFLVNGHLCMQGKKVDLEKLEYMVEVALREEGRKF